ncbi:hypothetical protein F4811DRAFT_554422 [Daldinia bambusicola]|nr:hypothetical protein F4811DRAFT_554422 [Daldinia bambusicola]
MAQPWNRLLKAFKSGWQYTAIDPEGTYDDKKGETASSPEKVVVYSGSECSRSWAGKYPCVSGPMKGCSRHNPRKVQIAFDEIDLSHDKTLGFTLRKPGEPRKDILQYDIDQNDNQIWSSLYRDHSTVDSLGPVHSSIRYDLAFYHTNWVQEGLSPESRRARVKTLACRGTVEGYANTQSGLRYWTYPCWHKDSFYLHQAVQFTIAPKERLFKFGYDFGLLWLSLKDWTFRTCPHQQQNFRLYQFHETRGLVKADMTFVTKWREPLGLTDKKRTEWQSLYGPGCYIFNCRFCHTDSYLDINLVEGKIVVYLLVWKDLGGGFDAYDPKWIAALRPEARIFKRSRSDAASNRVRSTVRAALRAEFK